MRQVGKDANPLWQGSAAIDGVKGAKKAQVGRGIGQRQRVLVS
jgi:hypothetical protein